MPIDNDANKTVYYDKNMVLTKDDFNDSIDMNQLLFSASYMKDNNGGCAGIRCSRCFLGKTASKHEICKRILYNKIGLLISYQEKCSIRVSYAEQFIKLFSQPRVHHINFMEE